MRFFIFFLVFFSLSSFSYILKERGDSVGSGGGEAERNFIYAYSLLPNTLASCLSTELCQITSQEKDLIKKISDSLPDELPVEKLLVFLAGSKYPHIFVIEGSPKVAVTGLKVGTFIHINTEMIYMKDEMGKVVPTRVSDAMAILVHELGHHQNISDHAALDTLGVKIARFFGSKSQEIRGRGKWSNISAQVSHAKREEAFSDFLLADGEKHFDITSQIARVLTCDKLILGDATLVGASIWNLHWSGGTTISGQNLRGRVEQVCRTPEGKLVHQYGYSEIEIKLRLKVNQKNQWELTAPFSVSEVLCSESPGNCS